MSEQSFIQEVERLLRKQSKENLSPYLYTEPSPDIPNDPVNGEKYYEDLIYNYPDYYLYREEINLIKRSEKSITANILPGSTVIEFGVGTEKAFRNKTMPFLQAIKGLKKYVPVDLCPYYLEKSKEIVESEMTGVTVEGLVKNFITHCTVAGDYKNPVVWYKGGTIGNLTPEMCVSFFQRLSAAMPKDSLIIVGTDSNQNPESLAAAYDNHKVARVMENILYRINRDCPVEGFDPKAFRYDYHWDAETHGVQHRLLATRTQQFLFKGESYSIAEGEHWHTLTSYKYPVSVFQEFAAQGGLILKESLIDDNQNMTIHIMQVA